MKIRPARDYVAAGTALRSVAAAACAASLSARQHRVLLAVLSLTVSYSKLEDSAYLAELARIVYAVEYAEPWQINNVGRELKALAELDIVWRQAPPRGRPSGEGVRYRFGLITAESSRDNAAESSSDTEETLPDPDAEHCRIQTQNAAGIGLPTGKVLEGTGEGDASQVEQILDDLASTAPPALPMSDPTPEHEAEFAEVLAAFTATEGHDRALAAVESLGRAKVRYASDFRKALDRWAREHPDRAAVTPIDLQAAALRRTADRNARRDRGETCPDCLDSGLVLDDHDTAHRCACQAAPA